MKHTFRSRRRIIEYYETKILSDIDRLSTELKSSHSKELEKQKTELEQEYARSLTIIKNEHKIKMQIEGKRVENELSEIIRVLNKYDNINREISETRDALQQIFAQARVIQTAIETKAVNDRVETAVYLNLLGAMGNLQQGMEEGKVVLPMATVTTQVDK